MASNISSPTIIGVLCATLERIEHSGEIDPGDPAFLRLKRAITRAIAEFEVAKDAKSNDELEPPLLGERG
jgi:hypothetical protein